MTFGGSKLYNYSLHEGIDLFPLGVDGSLQFPGLAHSFIPIAER